MKRIFTLVLLLLICGIQSFARDDSETRQTLKGIKGVNVVVEGLSPAAEGLVTVEQLRTDVELRLRTAGLNIGPAVVYLDVEVTIAKGHEQLDRAYVFNCRSALLQYVAVSGNSVKALVETWSTDYVAIVGRDNVSKAIRSTVSDQVDQFLNAYLSANPKN